MRKQKSFLYAACISSILILINDSGMTQVAINTDNSAPNASAMLDIKNTGKGVLIPRMTQVQRDAISSPANGLMIYQTDITPGFYYNAGTSNNPVWQLVGSPGKSVSQIALLQWYQPIVTYSAGPIPRGIAFDGKYMWIVNSSFTEGPGKVRRYDASGTVVDSSDLGMNASSIAFDGTHMWVLINSFSGRGVTKINATTGAIVDFYPTGDPGSLAFDGTNIWVTNVSYVSMVKINVTTGATETYPLNSYGADIAFDGTNIWGLSYNKVTKFNGSTGEIIFEHPAEPAYGGIAFDGINMWISSGTHTVLKLNLSGDTIGTYAVNSPASKEFDGTDMWICNLYESTVTRMNLAGSIVATYPVGGAPRDLAFDGSNMWIISADGKVTKIHK